MCQYFFFYFFFFVKCVQIPGKGRVQQLEIVIFVDSSLLPQISHLLVPSWPPCSSTVCWLLVSFSPCLVASAHREGYISDNIHLHTAVPDYLADVRQVIGSES